MPKYKTQTNDLTEVIEAGGGAGKKLYIHKIRFEYMWTTFVYTYDPTPKTNWRDYVKYMFNEGESDYFCYPYNVPDNFNINLYTSYKLIGNASSNPNLILVYNRSLWDSTSEKYLKGTYESKMIINNNITSVEVIEVQ